MSAALACGEDQSLRGCLGAFERLKAARGLSRHAVERKAILMSMLVVGVLFQPRTYRRRFPARQDRCHAHSINGFTLIEMLIVIMIVAIVAALTIPAFRDARRGSWRAVSLANLRFHSTVFAVYANDFRDGFPHYTDPLLPVTEVGSRIRGVGYAASYFGASLLWNYALADDYYGGDPFQVSFYPPDYPHGVRSPELRYGPTPYAYSCVFRADPAFWNIRTRTTGSSQWRQVFAHEVQFPSAKVLLISEFTVPLERDSNRPPRLPTNSHWELASVAGAAAWVPASRLARGYRRGDGQESPQDHDSSGSPGMHTIDGVRGRDW